MLQSHNPTESLNSTLKWKAGTPPPDVDAFSQPDVTAIMCRGNWQTPYAFAVRKARDLRAYLKLDGADGNYIFANSDVPLQSWTYVTMTYKNASLCCYVNGDLKDEKNDWTGTIDDGAVDLIFGSVVGIDDWFNGTIDEPRLSNISRSSAWVGASYETQRDHFIIYETTEQFPKATITERHKHKTRITPKDYILTHRTLFQDLIELIKLRRGQQNETAN